MKKLNKKSVWLYKWLYGVKSVHKYNQDCLWCILLSCFSLGPHWEINALLEFPSQCYVYFDMSDLKFCTLFDVCIKNQQDQMSITIKFNDSGFSKSMISERLLKNRNKINPNLLSTNVVWYTWIFFNVKFSVIVKFNV